MNYENEIKDVSNHNISIIGRKMINISGITKINSFDNEEFILETSLGSLGIKGNELEIIKLDTYEGTISIKGIIEGLSYLNSIKNKKEDGMITKLFK